MYSNLKGPSYNLECGVHTIPLCKRVPGTVAGNDIDQPSSVNSSPRLPRFQLAYLFQAEESPINTKNELVLEGLATGEPGDLGLSKPNGKSSGCS